MGVKEGRSERRTIVDPEEIENDIVGAPTQALADTIAALNEPVPASALVETTILHWEKATKEVKNVTSRNNLIMGTFLNSELIVS